MSRSLPLFAGSILLALALAGCGGGGGGGSARGSIAYLTTWDGSGGPSGVSQRVRVFDESGNLMDSKILNQTGTGGTLNFSNLKPGTYLVVAELNSGANFSGVTTGVSSIVVEVDGTEQVFTQADEVPTHINITPDAATFTVQQSQQFAATALNAASEGVFVDPDDIDWSTLGGVATVSSSGVVLGTSEGTGSVKATYTPLAFTDAAILNVGPFTTTTSKWTVLIYLNAANDLDEFGDLNVNQMEKVAGNSNVRFVVQWKQALIPGVSESPSFIGTRRYLLKHDTDSDSVRSELIQDMGTNVDMGDWQTLNEFVEWGKTFYPADRTVLVIWNHGNGWHRAVNRTQATRGVSYDDDMGTSVETWQLSQAMGSNTVDILAWDASLMQMLEVNNEIRDKATLIVGSEESPPGAGYPYDDIFQHFVNTPDASTQTLAEAFVDETLEAYQGTGEKITQSVLDSSKLAALGTAVDQLGAALKAQAISNPTDFALYIQTARLNAQTYSQSSARTYRDLIDLTVELDKTVGAFSPPIAITSANTAIRAAATDLILHEGHNEQSPDSKGISIDFSPQSRFVNYSADYALLKFAQDTQWDEWLAIAP